MEGSLLAGRYRIDERIGEGGVAVVYRGLDISLEREVAIKVLKPEYANDPEILERFRREAQAAAKLNHPNIVQIYDTGSDNGTYYIIMEYLPEPDFKHIIRKYGPLPLRKVLQVSIECCRALAYAHRLGIVHRDIKPHNVLFTDDGHAKLSDFGIAAAMGERGLTDQGTVLGSAHYISPEQAQGRASGPQADLYSLGIVIYEALTGSLPFTGKTPAEIAAKHVQEKVPPLRLHNVNIGPSVEFVVGKALMRDLARRYRDANEMLMDLEKLADGMELDQTGVLTPSGEEATVRFEAPVEPGPAPLPEAPALTPPAESGPRPQPNQAAMWAAMVAAIVVGILALAGVVWLAKAAFYHGHAPKNVQVPMLKGLAEAEAVQQLTEAGLSLGQVSYEETEASPAGIIIAQSPEGGATVRTETAVNITVSKGKQEVTVIDVVGKDLDTAKALLAEAGLHPGRIEWNFSDQVAANRVISQAIAPNAKVEGGAAVDLVVSKGPEEEAGPEQPPAGATGPTGDQSAQEQRPADPLVEITKDEAHQPANPKERRLLVRITAQGTEEGQAIKVILSDSMSPRLQVASPTLNPGDSVEIPVIINGNAKVEVHHQGKVVHSDTFMLEEPMPDGQ